MLIASVLILLACSANGLPDDQQGRRRTKQLDLQDIQTSLTGDLTTTLAPLIRNDEVINGYLPPAAPSSVVSNITSAQSQQTFEFKSVNSVVAEDEPCKPPFDQVSCDVKGSSKIPKPSRDLMPPFNSLEQVRTFPTNTPPKQEQVKIKTEAPTKVVTTTEKPRIKPYEQVPARTTLNSFQSKAPSTPTTKALPNKAEATNELRKYLPPQSEYSAAAQTNVAVIQSAQTNANQDHHHDHHHGHHHGENFNICDDAFHSFLCAPLKARKRITGAFPSNLRGSSSFINYQKFLPNFEREPASSNTYQNEYLPPKKVPSPTNLIQSTRLPPPTTKRPIVVAPTTTTTAPRPPPKIIPQPSDSNGKFYLPPLASNKIAPAPSNAPAPVFSALKPSTSPKPVVITTTRTTTAATFTNPSFSQTPFKFNTGSSLPAVFNSLSSNENKFYLPPNTNPNPQPSASFIPTSGSIYPTVFPTISPQPVVFASQNPALVTTFGPLSSNSIFLTQKPKPQTAFSVLSTTTKPFVVQKELQKTTFSGFVTTSSPIIQVSTSAPQTPSSTYFATQTAKTTESSAKPYSGFKFTEQSSNQDRSYLPPDPKEPAAAQISSEAVAAPQSKNPFHHGRDLCTDPFHSFLCVNAKPRKRITGQLPSGFNPESSNTNESRLSPEPSNQDENKVRPNKPLENAPTQNLGYEYPKPSNPLPTFSNIIPSSTASPSTGYSYPKPDKIFPLPSQQNVRLTASTTSTTAKPEPRPSEAKVVTGYQYPKPENIFPSPAVQSQVTQTTNPPTTGYSYPKPQKPFPSPTEQKELRLKPKQKSPAPQTDLASPTNQVKGYQYPKPEQSLKLPEKSGGYSYPKPTKRLELPTEARPKALRTDPAVDPLGPSGSADFIPVNKLNFKRSESKLVAGLRRFGERQKKRLREAQIAKKLGER